MQNNYEAEVYGMAYGGMGVARVDGKVYFIEGALPGEKVTFTKRREKKNFGLGRIAEILTPSSSRVEPVCPYYNKCGGCQYQHLDYEKEVYYKAEQVKENLGRIGSFREYSFDGIAPSPLYYGYRSSITLHRSDEGYGYFALDNKTIITIEQCPLAEDAINRAIKEDLNTLDAKRDITLKSDHKGNVWIKGYQGHRFFKDSYLGTELTFSPRAFSQANRQVAGSTVKKVRELMQNEKRETLFDLYCGTGFFGMLLRDMFESVVGIDESRIAIDCAKAAKKGLGMDNARFYCGEAEKRYPAYYEKLRGKKNTLIIDPPRSGISKKIAIWLSELKDAESLYYVSCDPAILARDAKILTQNDHWKLMNVSCFDMFPRTKHIESIALFKAGNKGT
ncbi:class I SAM-dependent RNA methyltransferase [Candidatus Omnitrophota bacterium]